MKSVANGPGFKVSSSARPNGSVQEMELGAYVIDVEAAGEPDWVLRDEAPGVRIIVPVPVIV